MRKADLAVAGKMTQRFRFSAAVAAFGQLLRGGRYTAEFDYDDVLALADPARGRDPYGYRAEFLRLVRLAKSLQTAAKGKSAEPASRRSAGGPS